MNKASIIGIDLGSSQSCIGIWENDVISIIPNEIGERSIPSYISFTDKERLFGNNAKSQITKNPNNTLFSIKRLIGENDSKYLNEKMESYPYKIIKNDNSIIPKLKLILKIKQEYLI